MDDNYPHLSIATAARVLEFGVLVEEAVNRLGLVARGDRGRIYSRHFEECLAPPVLERFPQGARILDVGSGGGFPGILIAIVREDVTVAMAEPREKKAAFLEKTVIRLGLPHTQVFAETVEDLGRRVWDPRFDLAISRGLHWTREMIRSLDPLLIPDGCLLRFGSLALGGKETAVYPLTPGSPRGIQVWPRASWEELPEAT